MKRTFGNTFGLALYDKDKANREVASPPNPDAEAAYERAVTDAQIMIESADSVPDLQSVWKTIGRSVQSDTRVIAAKDKRKNELTPKEQAA